MTVGLWFTFDLFLGHFVGFLHNSGFVVFCLVSMSRFFDGLFCGL